ncbi:MAG TPA: fatty acid--CoA ligase family protein [Actinomycetota bacterium]
MSDGVRLTGVTGPGDLVAVVVPQGPALPGLIERIWASGAAFIPLDAGMPSDRLEALLEAARPTHVVSEDGEVAVRRGNGGEPVDEDVALVVHTSGTGGRPKLAQFDRRALERAVASSAERLGATSEDAWLCCLPVAHVGGLLVILRAVLLGAQVTILPRADVQVIGASSAAFTSVVPTILRRLVDAGADLTGFRAILVGGSGLWPDERARAERAGATLVETYGLTESCGGVVYEGVPLAGTEVRLGPDDEVHLRGPTTMRGYRFDPAASVDAFTGDEWLRTGDAGAMHEGTLRIVGRLDDLIVSGGEKVWPDRVESALREHPDVGDVAVSGRPDPEWGHRVVAWVVPRTGAAPVELDGLRRFASSTLAPHELPREVAIIDTIPRTPSGKVVRRRLRPD